MAGAHADMSQNKECKNSARADKQQRAKDKAKLAKKYLA